MTQTQNQVPVQKADSDEIQIMPLLKRYGAVALHFWYWIVLSVVICFSAGFVYQLSQQRVYQRQGVILVDSEDSGNGARGMTKRSSRGNATTALMSLNGVSMGGNLKNEEFILSSLRLMERVVDTLGLDVDYTCPQSLHTIALYKSRPFTVNFTKKTTAAVSMKVNVKGGKFELSGFTTPKGPIEKTMTVSANEMVKTPIGEICITKERNFDKFDLDKEITVTHLPVKTAAAIYKAAFSAEDLDKESSLIVLGCRDINPDRATDIINEIVEAYKRDAVDNKNHVARNTAEFIDGRIALIGDELRKVEGNLVETQKRNEIANGIINEPTSLIAGSSAARSESLKLETELSISQYLYDFIRQSAQQDETIPVISGNQAVSSLITAYNQQMMTRNRLVENSNPNTPAVIDLDKQLAQARKAILQALNAEMQTIRMSLSDARANENLLTAQLGTIPEKEMESLGVKRQQELYEALYTYLLNKREEVALQMAVEEANVRMVEEPLGSPSPISPRTRIILLMAIAVGVAIPCVIFFLITSFDTTIASRKDVESLVTIPIAGELPHWESDDEDVVITSADMSDHVVTEAFRMLRYGLNFICKGGRHLLVTSSTPGQGKSFVSRNLSVVMAMTGKKVLLIDADIRKRTTSNLFGHSDGLTAFLSGYGDDVDIQSLILKGKLENVDFLPAGMIPPNPAELLMSDRLELLVEKLNELYDFVVWDTTPNVNVADANILNRIADATLYVVRVGVQQREYLNELQRNFEAGKFNNLCLVINDCNANARYYSRYKYSYGYGKKYGYGYGYGHNSKKKADKKKKK